MSIRLPLQTVLDQNNSVEVGSGPASLVGGIAYPFNIPQDADNIVLKLQASILAGGVSATLQTTDDGGTTWYDVARTSIVSNTGSSILGGTGQSNAEWLSVPVAGFGLQTTIPGQASTLGNTNTLIALRTTGSAAASSLGVSAASGLPILSQRGRVFMRYTSAVTSVISERIQVKVNSQSATA